VHVQRNTFWRTERLIQHLQPFLQTKYTKQLRYIDISTLCSLQNSQPAEIHYPLHQNYTLWWTTLLWLNISGTHDQKSTLFNSTPYLLLFSCNYSRFCCKMSIMTMSCISYNDKPLQNCYTVETIGLRPRKLATAATSHVTPNYTYKLSK